MDKSFVLILIISIFFIQCYSQNQFFPNDYKYNTNDELVSITLIDSTKTFYNENKHQILIKSDSLLIIFKVLTNNYKVDYIPQDTINLKTVAQLELLQFDNAKTTSLVFFSLIGIVVLIPIIVFFNNGFDINLGKRK